MCPCRRLRPFNTEYAEDGTESFLRLAYALFLSIEWNGREADATERVPPVRRDMRVDEL